MPNTQPTPDAAVSALPVASAPKPMPMGIKTIYVEFTLGDRPPGAPGKKDFQLKDVLGLSSPLIVRDICAAANLNMRMAITKQNKLLLQKVLDTLYITDTQYLSKPDEERRPVLGAEGFGLRCAAPGSISGSNPAHSLNPGNDDVAAMLAAGKQVYSRFSTSLLPLGSMDLFGDNESLSDASEPNTGAKTKGGKGGGATLRFGKAAALTSKSVTTAAAKGSEAKAKSQTKEPTATTTRRKTRSSANA
ncbi:hypothetical protein FRC12_006881 [Ceratobasidium sp. 428]|nr:hypothetical protein FRC12_006881 [Ceratobasidium sp. 428]